MPLFDGLHKHWPDGLGCSICGRSRAIHAPGFDEFKCERCGAKLYLACFYEHLATEAERRWHYGPEHTPSDFIFMCRGCRQ